MYEDLEEERQPEPSAAGRIDELGLQVDTSGDIPDLSLGLEPLNCTVEFFFIKAGL